MLKNMAQDKNILFRISADLDARLYSYAEKQGTTKSEAIRQAIEQRLSDDAKTPAIDELRDMVQTLIDRADNGQT